VERFWVLLGEYLKETKTESPAQNTAERPFDGTKPPMVRSS
jgi:hypothetical protein